MALKGYLPKTKKALWTQIPSALAEAAALHDRREAAKASKLNVRKLKQQLERRGLVVPLKMVFNIDLKKINWKALAEPRPIVPAAERAKARSLRKMGYNVVMMPDGRCEIPMAVASGEHLGLARLLGRKPVRRVSKQRQAQSSGYVAAARAFVAAEIEAGKTCPVFPGEPLAENHHRFGKRGRLLMWKPGWLAVSSKGHYWITNNTTSARVNGFVGPVGTWNDYERAVEHQRSKA